MTNREQEIENKINEKGLNAPRLSPEKIEDKIASFSFQILPSGKSIVCEISLVNGFTVRGDSAVVSKENFNEEIGKEIAYDNARKKIWELEAYLLQEELYKKDNSYE